LEFEAVQNPNVTGMDGEGVQSGQFMYERPVKAVLTGNDGLNIFRTLQAAGIDIITGVFCSGEKTIEKYKSGGFNPAGEASVDSKFSIG
jgi:predicted Fe-Mo cluster-binding NifX family protein